MAQNVEASVNIKINADANDIQSKTEQLKTSMMDLINIVSKLDNIQGTCFDSEKVHNFISVLQNDLLSINKIVLQLSNTNLKSLSGEQLVSKLSEIDNILNKVNSDFSTANNILSQNQQVTDDMTNNTNEYAEALNNISRNTENASSDIDVLKEAFGGAAGIISELASHLGINVSNLKDFGSVLSKLSPAGAAACAAVVALVAVMKTLWKETSSVVDKLNQFLVDNIKKLPGAFSDIASNGIGLFTDALADMQEAISSAIESLKELSEVGIEANDTLFVMNNYLGTEGASQLEKYINTLGDLKGINATYIEKSLKGLFGSLSNMNLNTDELVDYSETFINFMNDLSVYQGSTVDSIASQLESALSFGVLNSRSALAKALDITDEMIESFKELGSVEERAQWILSRWPKFAGKYDEWLKTDQGKVTSLKNNWQNLMSSVGQLALKVYAIVAPLLTNLLSLVNTVLSSFLKLIGKDASNAANNSTKSYDNLAKSIAKVGSSSKKVDKATKSNDKLAKSISNVGKSAKKAERQTASFDDVIQLNKNNTSSKSGGSGSDAGIGSLGTSLANLDTQIDKTKSKFEKLMDAVKNAMDKGDFYEAGKLISHYISDILEAIDWNKIKSKAESFGKGLGQFTNGVIDNIKLFKGIGKTLAEGLNTITTFLYNLGTTIHWDSLGKGIVTSITTFFDNFDPVMFADAIFAFVGGLIDTFETAIDQMFNEQHSIDDAIYNGWTLIGHRIAQTINEFFKDFDGFDAENLAFSIVDFITGIFNTAAQLLADLDLDQLGDVVAGFVKGIVDGFAANSAYYAQTICDLIGNILKIVAEDILTEDNINAFVDGFENLIYTAVENIDAWLPIVKDIVSRIAGALKQIRTDGTWNEILDAIGSILSDSGIPELVSEIVLMGIQLKFRLWWETFKEKVSSTIKAAGSVFVQSVKDVFALIIGVIILAGASIVNKIKEPITKAINFIKEHKDTIINTVKEIPVKIKEALSGLVDIITSPFKKAIDTVTGWFNNFNPFKKLESPNISVNVPYAWSGKHAKGGITNGPSVGMIGEAGKEAVLPLENNTEWMNILADKISSKISNGTSTSGSQIVIDMSKFKKNVYTRSEMLAFGEQVVKALKVYGVNVAMV